MADLQDFVGTWHAERGAPFSTHTFTWAATADGLRGEWTIEAGGLSGGGRVRKNVDGSKRHHMKVGTPTLDGERLLFDVNDGPYATEFRLVGEGEAILGAALDKLPRELAGLEHHRSIEGHRVLLRKHIGAAACPALWLRALRVFRALD